MSVQPLRPRATGTNPTEPRDPIGVAMETLTLSRIRTHGMLTTQLYDELLTVRSMALKASRALNEAALMPDRAYPDEYHAAAAQARRAAKLLGRAQVVFNREGEPSQTQFTAVERLVKRAAFLIDNAWIGAYTGTHH